MRARRVPVEFRLRVVQPLLAPVEVLQQLGGAAAREPRQPLHVTRRAAHGTVGGARLAQAQRGAGDLRAQEVADLKSNGKKEVSDYVSRSREAGTSAEVEKRERHYKNDAEKFLESTALDLGPKQRSVTWNRRMELFRRATEAGCVQDFAQAQERTSKPCFRALKPLDLGEEVDVTCRIFE